MKKMLPSVLKQSFLFDGLTDNEILNIITPLEVEILHFEKNRTIFSPESYERKVGFVIIGECVVVKKRTGFDDIPLSIINIGGSFGILTCFTMHKEYPTYVISKQPSTVAFFKDDDIINLAKTNTTIAFNVIKFLGNRIDFLNDKITAFSSPSVEMKLVSYLLSEYREHNSLVLEINKAGLAHKLGAGRASVYRAIQKLKDAKIITTQTKKIIINDLTGLERMSR